MFATTPDNALSGFVSEATNVILRIRDYNSSDVLLEISRDNRPQHFIMDWPSTAVIVEIKFYTYWWTNWNSRVKILLTSRPSKYYNNYNAVYRPLLRGLLFGIISY